MIIDQKNGFSSPNYGLTVDMENFLGEWKQFMSWSARWFSRDMCPRVLPPCCPPHPYYTCIPSHSTALCTLLCVSESSNDGAAALGRGPCFRWLLLCEHLEQQMLSHVLSLLCRSLRRAAGAFLQYGSRLSQRAKKRPPCPTSWGHFTFSSL